MQSGRLLRPREAWDRLGISRGTGYALMREGKLAYVRVGSDRRIPESAIEDYIAAHLVTKGAA